MAISIENCEEGPVANWTGPDMRWESGPYSAQTTGGLLPINKETRKKTRKRTKRTCAIHAEVPAIPAKPNTPAIMATTRNISAHARNIARPPSIFILFEPAETKLELSKIIVISTT